jgi:hypothetical protein
MKKDNENDLAKDFQPNFDHPQTLENIKQMIRGGYNFFE